MNALLHDVSALCAELRCEKPATRNKAAERLDAVLVNSKSELILLLGSTRSESDVSWKELFNTAFDATLKHASKLEEMQDSKNIQAMRNKNYIFRAILTKLVDYNLEEDNKLLSKTILLTGFIDGVCIRNAIKPFGTLFLYMLDRGIYKSSSYVRDLKVNEFSRILSHLFEVNVADDDILRFAILSSVIKTIELSIEHVQLSPDLIDYLPETMSFARKATNEKRKADVIKLFHLFVSQLAVDYHHTVCNELLMLLPVICEFYDFRMTTETKETFFNAIYISLYAIYPLIGKGDFNTIDIPLEANWIKTVKKIKTVIDLEIKERKLTSFRFSQSADNKCMEQFFKVAAVVVYLIHWHFENSTSVESRPKIAKESDKIEIVLNLVQPQKATFNEIWLAILTEMISNQETIINNDNFSQVLETLVNILQAFGNANNLKNLRLCLTSMLRLEEHFVSMKYFDFEYCKVIWTKLTDYIISESSPSTEIICEKQLLLQSLIAHKKFTIENCEKLLNIFMSNPTLKRTECIQTVRQILIYADQCGLNKTSDTIGNIITWMYRSNDKFDVKSVLLNIAPIEADLTADTSAIAVINFLNEKQTFQTHCETSSTNAYNTQILLYKYNKQLVCFEECGKKTDIPKNWQSTNTNGCNEQKNCLFQNNYELLMRMLDFKTSMETTCSAILSDLKSLHKITTVMKAFLKYKVFSEEKFMQCPLMKRTGFFLSHLEFQLKKNNPIDFERSDLFEMLQRLERVFTTFTSDAILLQYLEKQPLEELIEFLGKSLKFSVSQQTSGDFEDWLSVSFICLRILAILCASATHYRDAFAYISKAYAFNIKTDLSIFLTVLEIFCLQKSAHLNIAEWFVDKLKTIFKLYYTHIETIDRIVDLLPAVFNYVHDFEDSQQNMLIALISLLKVAYRKSYSVRLTTKLVNSVKIITQISSGMHTEENFINICLSTAKFLHSSSLEIQFATIRTITALMSVKRLNGSSPYTKEHFQFCQQLFAHIDWKNLPTTTIDLKQNSDAVTIQILVSLFVFSCYHQEVVLQELASFCALRKLREDDLKAFKQISSYFDCSLPRLTKPYTASLIHTWTSSCAILNYPYFLCCNTIDDFVVANLSQIPACLLLYQRPDSLRKLAKYASVDELQVMAVPIAQTFILPRQAGCPEAETPQYKRHIDVLDKNVNDLKLNLSEENINWKTVYHSIQLLRDDRHFEEFFGFSIYCQQKQWFHISCNSLRRCLAFYINGDIDEARLATPFSYMLQALPLDLIHVFGALKEDCFSCLFPTQTFKCFYAYCTAAELLLDSIPTAGMSTAVRDYAKFFIRDIVFFTLNSLQKARELEMQRASLRFLYHILNKPVVAAGCGFDVIKAHLNDICKSVVAAAENAKSLEIEQFSVKILQHLIVDNKDQLGDAIALLDELPMTDVFAELRSIQHATLYSDDDKDFFSAIKSFLHTKNRGIDGLKAVRLHVSKGKSLLQQDADLLYTLMKRLIEIVRNSKKSEFGLEALKCLGDIGSLKIDSISYYFQTDVSFYEQEAISEESIYYFIQRMLAVIEKLLLVFDENTHGAVCEVAQQLVKYKGGQQLTGICPLLKIFSSNKKLKSCLDTYASIRCIDWISILKTSEAALDYDQWICTFASQMFKSCGWSAFQELSSKDAYFASASLQPFIRILMVNKDQHLESLVTMLQYFFTELFQILEPSTNREGAAHCKVIFKDKRIIKTFLYIGECIRIHNEWMLPINLLYVAKASNHCQAYFMSILYLELWALCEKRSPSGKLNSEILGNACFQKTATKAYQSIGCSDAISGFLNPLESRIEYLSLNNDWSDILLEAGTTELISDRLYTSILKRNGMLSLANLKQTSQAIDYEVCWRLCQWDTTVAGHSKVNTLNDMEHEFEKHHFNALKCLHNREENNSLAAIANARRCILSILNEISVECLQSVYKYLTWLQVLQQAEDFCQVQFVSTNSVSEIFEKWQIESNLQYGSFRCKEHILSHQIALFNLAGLRADRKINEFYKVNPIETCLLKCIKECVKAGEVNLAKRNIALLKNTNVSTAQVKISVLLEDAEICIKTGKSQISKAILESVLKNRDFARCPQRVRAFKMYGEYMMESNTEPFETVLRKYFNGSMELLKKYVESKEKILQENPHLFDMETFEDFERNERKNGYEAIAKYADREYTQLNCYLNSDDFQMKLKIIKQNRLAANSIGKQNTDRDKNIGAVVMKKFANLDEQEVDSIKQKCTENLCIAVENYMKFCMVDEVVSSPAIYRVIALWFANKQNVALQEKIEENFAAVPSYKFVCALNQITARLNSQNAAFVDVIKKILIRCAQDHPHQTLYQLYSLVFAFSDGTTNKGNNRVKIAKEIIAKAKSAANADSIKQLEIMFPALIEFAEPTASGGKDSVIALSDKLRRLKHLDAVQCPTIELPVSKDMNYRITSIVKWEDKVSLVGGITAPKKITCVCSDGKKRPQLLKGKDDLRQDAMMQQVFSIINDLLKAEPETVDRKLLLRTYKVVPLSMRSGILEWCENTIPIGVYLAGDGKGGAHNKYHPEDYTNSKCRQLAMQHQKSDVEKRHQIYVHICQHVKPALHYFFFEKFLIPGVWFERRLAYTNSVATTSIVGFIVGLGDRHTQNILIDEETGEVIHIDFGIAFEQGKIMPTPETVPFRLTRDMVSPMGVCETNGVFKKSCEVTMRCLHRNQSVITTILEVLLYDPLYIWKVVPQIGSSSDGNTHEEKNLTAQRALLTVQNKLEGKQAGILGVSEVEVQVQRLINEAVSSRNLCQLYPGWDPYL